MQYRAMQACDIAEVVAIENAATAFPWTVTNCEDSLKSGHYDCVFLDENDQVIGFCFVQRVADEAHLLNICVMPSCQGQGFGREILNHVIRYAQQISAVLLVLEVRRSNRRAQQLYLHAGFNEMAVRKNYYPAEVGREDAILMGMDLSLQ